MSVELQREVRAYVEATTLAGAGLSPAEALVLYELADMAQDKDREGFPARTALPDREVFAARCGLTVDGLRKVLQRLAVRGLEVRLPVSTDRNGEPVYAVPGRRTRFRLPHLSRLTREAEASRWDERTTKVGQEDYLGGPSVPPTRDERATWPGREDYLNPKEPEGEPEQEPEGEPSDRWRDRGQRAASAASIPAEERSEVDVRDLLDEVEHRMHGFEGAEDSTARGMLANGSAVQAVVNTIGKQRLRRTA